MPWLGCWAAASIASCDCIKPDTLTSVAANAWARDILIGRKKPGQRTAAWSPQEFAALPDTLTLRQIRLHIDSKGCRTRTIIVVTTLLDSVTYPAETIAALYLERWSVELHFREKLSPQITFLIALS